MKWMIMNGRIGCLYWLLVIGLNVEWLHDWLLDVNIGWLIVCMFLNVILMGLSVCVHIHESVYEYVHLSLAHICRIVEEREIGVEIYSKSFETVLEMFH